jgi:AAA ATPase domain
MQQVKRAWQFLLQEPFTWIFYYLFQPTKFRRDIAAQDRGHRLVIMLRLALPMFLCCFPMVLVTRILLDVFYPEFYIHIPLNDAFLFLYQTAWSTALGVVGGMAGVIVVDTTSNIALSFAVALVAGSVVDTHTTVDAGIHVLIVAGILYGLASGLLLGLTVEDNQEANARNVISTLVGGIIGSIIGCACGLSSGFLVGSLVGFADGNAVIPSSTADTLGATGGCLAGAFVIGFVGSTVKSLARRSRGNLISAIAVGRSISILFAILAGIVGGAIGELAINRGILSQGLAYNLSSSAYLFFVSGVTFLVCYVLSYYRFPLYPVSSISSWRAYRASQRSPEDVFRHLRYSSLYWDERVFLPLPHLKDMLLLAANQNFQRTLEQVAFIVAERPLQIVEAREAVLAIAVSDLEQCRTMAEIAQASQQLTTLLLPEIRQTGARWLISLTSVSDASRSAALCCSPISRQARHKALDEMILHLNKVRAARAFEDVQLSNRLQGVVKHWMTAALQEVGKLRNMPNLLGNIDNPYVPGPSLQLGESSFVGRQDLVQQLEQALSKGRNRPTFFLTGERRMGKTSTLNQLPRLLSARYLPIYYDLQSRGASSNSAAFLSTIVREMVEVMQKRGLRVRKLKDTHFIEAQRENAAAPYRLFDEWFHEVEDSLKQDDLTILLIFDEFEKLQEAKEAHYLDLQLLLDWFRSLIQNRPRLALLFSGLRGLRDMGTGWAGYFVNAQMLKVGFLSKPEALRLITKPVPDYPSEQIFEVGVVEEIMKVTGNHPFLVQATCSKLIDLLNIENRDWAEVSDVTRVMEQVLESWWDTYFQDLWERTTLEQQTCLFVLQGSHGSTLQEIVQQSQLEERTVRNTLTVLLRRDLILQEQDTYRVSTPMFCEWVKRHA